MVSMMSGQETNSLGLVKFHQFIVPCTAFPLAKEIFVWEAARGVDPRITIRTSGKISEIPAVENARVDMGKWLSSTYDIPAGCILKMFVFKKTASNPVATTAAMFVRLREGAPLTRISAILTGYDRSTITRAACEGRFDVLNHRDLKAAGVVYNNLMDRQMDPLAVNRCFEKFEMKPSDMAKPVHETQAAVNEQGQVTAVEMRREGRALDL